MANGAPVRDHVVVIGAGVMGSGIAAHMANLGWRVSLLDIPPTELTPEEKERGAKLTDEDVRRRVVNSLWQRAKKARPPHFYLPQTAGKVRRGNVEDHLEWVRDAGWVVEAVVEKMAVKRALYARLEPLLPEDAWITTNTSGLSISELCEGRSESFRRRFIGTHFFNPPRYLKLLELIPTPDTDGDILKAVEKEGEDAWGKRVVIARDTPGFIANRLGMFCMVQAVHAALEHGLTVEEADALTGPLLGRPKTASFRLNDLVGLDIMQDVAGNQHTRLTHDRYRDTLQLPEPMLEMLKRRWLGNKSGQGFYRREGKEFFALDLQTLEYRPTAQPEIEGLDALMKAPWHDRLNTALLRQDKYGRFLRSHVVTSLCYALYAAPEISDTIVGIDRVMRWGFGWEKGPFEIVDEIGIKPFIDFVGAQGLEVPGLAAELHDLGQPGFYKRGAGRTSYFEMAAREHVDLPADARYICLADLKAVRKPIGGNKDASILDLGDGVLCVEFHTKMNALSPEIPPVIVEAVERAEKDKLGLVIGNEGRAFSAGFNLKVFLEACEAGDKARLNEILKSLQACVKALRYAKVPTVAAVHGHALGGGCEVAMHCNRAVAAPESIMGLPEVTVGVIPSAGGTTTMTLRSAGLAQRFEAFKLIHQGVTSANADHARELRFLATSDGTCYNADQLLFAAKQATRGAVKRRRLQPAPGLGRELADKVERYLDQELSAGNLTEYDCVMARAVAGAMCGEQATLTEEELHEKEREAFLSVCTNPQSMDRMRHMLETGKPLRN
jgi:3-hydroxyacyl-CoA dehydrogenase